MKQLIIAVLSILCATSLAMAGGSFQGIGYMPGYGSAAYTVSADGSFVVGNAGQDGHAAGETEAYLWTEAGGIMFLGDLPGGPLRSFGWDVSDDGMAVTGEGRYDADSLEVQAFHWTPGTGMVGLGFLPGGTYSTAIGISADGSVVVGTSQSTERQRQAFRWTEAGGMQGLGGPVAGTNSFAFDVTPDGATVVGMAVFSGSYGLPGYWTEGGGWVSIGKLPGGLESLNPFATDVSEDGSAIAGNSPSTLVPYSYEGFRWTASEGMVGMGLLLPTHNLSPVTGLSGDGEIVVGVSGPYSGIDRKPYIWDETNGMRELSVVLENDYGLDLTGWTLVEVVDISRDGKTFVGYGTNPLGFTEGWIATITEPTISAELACTPSSGTIPFDVTFEVTMTNNDTGNRKFAGSLALDLAGGQHIANYRQGYTNMGPGSVKYFSWVQTFLSTWPVGVNTATLATEDVTPAPYNQPPFPPAGDTATATCTVIGIAP